MVDVLKLELVHNIKLITFQLITDKAVQILDEAVIGLIHILSDKYRFFKKEKTTSKCTKITFFLIFYF